MLATTERFQTSLRPLTQDLLLEDKPVGNSQSRSTLADSSSSLLGLAWKGKLLLLGKLAVGVRVSCGRHYIRALCS